MTMKRIYLCIAVILCAASVCGAQQHGDATAPPLQNGTHDASSVPANTPTFSVRNPRYQLRPGDTFDLDFRFQPEFNQAVAVQPDGFITLKDVGEMFVQNLTIPQATELIKNHYSKILNDPVITLTLKDFEKPFFVAGGEVGKPGKYDLRSDVTAAEAVQLAGGFTPAAKHSQVLLFRRVSNDWTQVRKLDMKKMLADGSLREDIHLQPGDMLFVPKNSISKIRQYLPNTTVSSYFRPNP